MGQISVVGTSVVGTSAHQVGTGNPPRVGTGCSWWGNGRQHMGWCRSRGWAWQPSTPGLPSMLLGWHLWAIGEARDCLQGIFQWERGESSTSFFPKTGTLALVISRSRNNLERKEKWRFYPILWALERRSQWGIMATLLRTGVVSVLEMYLLAKVTQDGSV